MLAARMPPPKKRTHGSIYHRLEMAFEWLERAYEERDGNLGLFLKVEPLFVRLHSDPRFQDLLRRMNFPGAS